MRNARAVVATIVLATGLALPAGSVATGAPGTTPRPEPAVVVVTANRRVAVALEHLRTGREVPDVEVVRVKAQLGFLLADQRFVANAHLLQDHLNRNDAGRLAGAGVAIRDLLAADVRPDGSLVLFTR